MAKNTLEEFDLKESIAVITGGAGFLGEKHAEAILDANGRVVIVDINSELLEKKIVILKKKYGDKKAFGYILDITKEDQIKEVVKKIEKEVGPIGILINNAANNPHVKADGNMDFSRLENFPREVWDNDMAVGLTGAFLMSKYIAPLMAKRGKGVVLNIASELGLIAPDQRLYRKEGLAEDQQPVKPITYSVVKHGIIGLTKYLATYWLGGKVRSNAVAFRLLLY
jgi:NAD(P)-dependent dehydrogenase (short-subunit alcohol dehydrogenase family)